MAAGNPKHWPHLAAGWWRSAAKRLGPRLWHGAWRRVCGGVAWVRRRARLLELLFALLLALGLALVYGPVNRAACLAVHPSGELCDRRGLPLSVFLNDRQQWCFVRTLPEISPYLIRATLAAEDRRFYRHPGVDPVAIVRALWQNVSGGRVVSGASTLTMQVIKQTGRPSATPAGKLRQAVLALRLERRAGKDEILAAYLNTAPYGLNLIGCEAAARRYFGKPARELTLAEAALLAGLPKAPTSYMPLRHPEAARRRRDVVLRRMWLAGSIGRAEYRRARAERLGVRWHPFAQYAPHLAQRLQPAVAAQGRVLTTLDGAAQATAERLVREAVAACAGRIGNAAAVVLDAPTATVLAHVGSVDFTSRDPKQGGQYDATRAQRSPGSALKPFTYALALERGQLYPDEILLDDSLDYGLYHPENMDRHYHGLVPAGEALRRSLNVPAVTILGRIGVDRLYDFLHQLGLTTLTRPADQYGLGLTLGGCEVRLEELAAAYAALANLGCWRPLAFTRGELSLGRHERQVFSEGTGLSLYRMMEQPLPGELASDAGPAPAGPVLTRVCWKTGTSWGHHDAWTVVFNRHYVVAVWMGNNDGRGVAELTGAQRALPLASRIFRALPSAAGPAWPNPSGQLKAVQFCATSGLPASPWCPQTSERWLPREQFIGRICDMHYPLVAAPVAANSLTTSTPPEMPSAGSMIAAVTASTGTLTLAALPGGTLQAGERWPGSAHDWDLAHITGALERPATLLAARGRRDGLSILSPANHAEFIMTGAPDGDHVPLTSSLDLQTPIHWYLDDVFLGTAQPQGALLLPLTPGPHRLVCMTPTGQTAQAQYTVIDPRQTD